MLLDAGTTLLLFLVAGLALDAWFGDMPSAFRFVPHPIVLVGRAVTWFDSRLNRENRSERARWERGIFTVVVLVGAAILAGLVMDRALEWVWWGWLIEIVLVAVLVAQRSLFDHVSRVAYALDTGGLAAGRDAVRHIVGRDPASLDAHGVGRAAIESLAENFSDGVVAPSFWYALFGLPGLFAYKVINTLDSMIGHKSPRYRAFGWAAARLDDLVNLVPARLSGLIISGAALTHAAGSVRTMIRDAAKHRSPNAGWPEAAMAGALGLALAGPRRYGGALVEDAWIGDGRARVTTADIRRALTLFLTACGVHAALWLGIYAIGRL